MALALGDTLGPFEIASPLGSGGMGEVWKARDTRLGRIVAVKASKIEYSERFAGEARAIAALNHPNICQWHCAFERLFEFQRGLPGTPGHERRSVQPLRNARLREAAQFTTSACGSIDDTVGLPCTLLAAKRLAWLAPAGGGSCARVDVGCWYPQQITRSQREIFGQFGAGT